MTDKKMKPIDSLKFDPANSRKHDERNIKAIMDSLERHGQRKPIVCYSDMVVAGNGTLQAAKRLGWKEIWVNEDSFASIEDAKAYAIQDNRSAELATWDDVQLGDTLQELKDAGWDLEQIGFNDADLKDLIDKPQGTDGLTDPDEVPEVAQNEFGVKRGDIWQLGNHRLMCGDSTLSSDVTALMNGEKADMVFTDPPYGMSYGGGRTKKFGMILGDDENPTKFYDVLKWASEVYLWGRIENWDHLPSKPRDVIVWKKNNFGLGKGYRGQYEVCFYFGDFKGSDSDVWEVAKDQKYVHPTQKPVELCERAIKNSNPKGILDLFLGSGSTLIACEKTGRKCYGMELDETYCSVIIKRWQDFTGKKAERIVEGA
jgi:DNA modification methylase